MVQAQPALPRLANRRGIDLAEAAPVAPRGPLTGSQAHRASITSAGMAISFIVFIGSLPSQAASPIRRGFTT